MILHTLQIPPQLPKQRARVPLNDVNQSKPAAPNVGFSGQLMKKHWDQLTMMTLLLSFAFASLTLPVTIMVYKLSIAEDDPLLIAKLTFEAQVKSKNM